MKISDIIVEGEGSQVKAAEPAPKKAKPSRSGQSPHPYQGRLVGSKKNTGNIIEEEPVDEAPGDIRKGLGALALIAALYGGAEMTSAKHTPLGKAMAQAAQQGDEVAAKHLKNLDFYTEENPAMIIKLSNKYLNDITEEKKPKPTKPEKWAYAKAEAKKKFDVYPSAYANAWAAKKYKELGGGWRS